MFHNIVFCIVVGISNVVSFRILCHHFRNHQTSPRMTIKPDKSKGNIKIAAPEVEIKVSRQTMDNSLQSIYQSPEAVAILSVYFVQGALGLSRLAVTYFLKDDLNLLPAESAALMGFTSLPWLLKPIYGFLSDGFPIYGYKRRSYLVIAGIMGCLSWIALGTIVHDASTAFLAITIGSLSIAISDVVVDSIVVERSRLLSEKDNELIDSNSKEIRTKASPAGADLQSLCWSASSLGGIMSAYFSGSLLQYATPKFVFLLTSIFPLIITGVSFLINEQPISNIEAATLNMSTLLRNSTSQLKKIFSTMRNPSIYLPILFIFLWQATPSPDSAMFYFTTNELGFDPEFLGRIRLASSFASLAGVLSYRTWLKNVSARDIIFWTTLISVPLSLTQLLLTTHYNRVLGIPDQLFALTDSVVLTVLGQIAFMPTLTLAAAVCPPGVEGTLFATLMSIYNASFTVGSELGAGLTAFLGITDKSFDQLSLLVVICSLSSLLPLLFIDRFMKRV
mmetsp:Transcript_380/g.602  ORF Transcript_380/g.602 Transcript_380/m.602 type:complete len:506 (+) Transcript_380:1-1518(+)